MSDDLDEFMKSVKMLEADAALENLKAAQKMDEYRRLVWEAEQLKPKPQIVENVQLSETQRKEIIQYVIDCCNVKSVWNACDSVAEAWTEENEGAMTNAIDDVLNDCVSALTSLQGVGMAKKFKLTNQQINDVIDYYAESFEAKPIFEDVQSFYDINEEDHDAARDAVYEVLESMREACLELKQ